MLNYEKRYNFAVWCRTKDNTQQIGKMKNEIDEIEALLADGKVREALARANELIVGSAESDELYYIRGKLNWRAGDTRAAVTDFESAVALNPESPARHALEMARDINDFFNPDLLNP